MQKNLNIEKIIFKVVQMKILAMHINNKKYVLIYLRYKIPSWNMIFISNEFWHEIKMYNFEQYTILLQIYLMTARN